MSAPADMVAINVTADMSQEWDDAEGHISILRGQCRIVQGSTVLAGAADGDVADHPVGGLGQDGTG